VLLAMSDNGPQMRSHTTREFMAACAIMQRFGRPGTPTDQAWVESLFGYVKGEWPYLEKVRDPAQLALDLEAVRVEYNTVRLHAGIGYVTPDDEHEGRGDAIRPAGPKGSPTHARSGSTSVEPSKRTNHDRAPVLVGYFSKHMSQRLRYTPGTPQIPRCHVGARAHGRRTA
jgi:hypothetical protein